MRDEFFKGEFEAEKISSRDRSKFYEFKLIDVFFELIHKKKVNDAIP
jgi:hypothetical protein